MWVFGLVERTMERRIFLIQVNDRKKQTLNQILKDYVHPESIILSDCWKAYTDLNLMFSKHSTVNHSLHFKDPITGIHTNTIEGNWSAIKDQTSRTYRTKTRINTYLVRYMFLRNHPSDTFETILKVLLN